MRELSKDKADQSDMRFDLAMALNLGDLLTADKNLDGADDFYLEALAIEHEITVKVPKEPEWRYALAATLLKLAAIGDDPVAHLREALTVAKDLQQKDQLPQPGLVEQIEQLGCVHIQARPVAAGKSMFSLVFPGRALRCLLSNALEKNTDHTAAASSRSRSVGARPMNKTAIHGSTTGQFGVTASGRNAEQDGSTSPCCFNAGRHRHARLSDNRSTRPHR